MAERRRRSAPRPGTPKPWIIGAVTLGVGLGLGLLIAHHEARAPAKRPTAPLAKRAQAPITVLKPPAAPKPKGPAPGLPAATQFDFYTILPEMRGQAKRTRPAPASPAAEAPARGPAAHRPRIVRGHFILQAASFPDRADASRLRAELALRGLKSYIEQVSISGRGAFYRVRLGPLQKPAIAHARAILARLGLKPIVLREARGN